MGMGSIAWLQPEWLWRRQVHKLLWYNITQQTKIIFSNVQQPSLYSIVLQTCVQNFFTQASDKFCTYLSKYWLIQILLVAKVWSIFQQFQLTQPVSSLTEIIWILFLDVVRSKDARIRILEEELKAADNEKLTLMHEKETAVKEVQNDFIIIGKTASCLNIRILFFICKVTYAVTITLSSKHYPSSLFKDAPLK